MIDNLLEMASMPPERVLHIVESLHTGAVENWLARMYRHAHSMGILLDWTFYCQIGGVASIEDEVRDLGAKVIHSPVPLGQKLKFVTALRAELMQGNYDVIHCHHDLVSAVYLVASVGVPVHLRVVHVHNADEDILTPSRLKKFFLRGPMRSVCLTLADKIVGISNHTLDTFLNGRIRQPNRDIVHYYGIDAGPFIASVGDRDRFRTELGLENNSLVLLFAGRLVPEKNPGFVLDVLQELRKLEPRVVGVFVGSGSEEQSLRSRSTAMELDKVTRFLGWRKDIPDIMSCCDWFILPRPEEPMEGFGIAVVEAQLAGLRLILSTGIPDDPLLPGSCVRRLSLSEKPLVWAQAAFSQLLETPPSRAESARVLDESPMQMNRALCNLLKIYKK